MAKRQKLTSFPWNALPAELQTILLRTLSLSTLGKACRLNKAVSAQAVPIFWSSIELKDLTTVDPSCSKCGRSECSRSFASDRLQLEQMLQGFFLTCHLLQQTRPTRWKELAAHVTCLRLVKVPDMQFGEWLARATGYQSHKAGTLTHGQWPFPTPQDPGYYAQKPTIWDVISDFKSLEVLEIYNQQSLGKEVRTEELAHKLQGALPRLRKLKIGGDVSMELMSALLLTAHNTLEELSCIALLDGTVGQDYYSRGLLYLAQVSSKKRFPNLRSLHLCKVAELSEFPPPADEDDRPSNEESGVPWPLEESDDVDSLQDWAAFIERVSNNLETLTLEDCYLVGNRFRDRARLINPGNTYSDADQRLARGPHVEQDEKASFSESPDDSDNEEPNHVDPVHWGAGSRRRFRETLLPVLAEQAWPRLERLVLVGLALPGEAPEQMEAGKSDLHDSFVELHSFLDRLSSRNIDVEHRAAGVMKFNYNATPLVVSPSGSWYAG